MTRQDLGLCAYCGNREATDEHHLLKRSTSPELKQELKNLVKLCRVCHTRTETDMDFAEGLRLMFYYWNKANLDLFLRAQASVEALLQGKEVEYLTPAMADHYLQLANAAYSFYSERLAECEQEYAPYFVARPEKTNKSIEMEWGCTERGREMIVAKRKTKSLEKLMSNLRARLNRFRTEYYAVKNSP